MIASRPARLMPLSRRRLAKLAPGLLLPCAARAQTPANLQPGDADAIQVVIERQIAAFRADDADAAFAFASPMIRGMFETPERFMAMVRGLYLPVYRPRQVQFGDIVAVEGRLVQKVELIGPDGTPALALYTMKRTPEGWRIDGVALTASAKLAA